MSGNTAPAQARCRLQVRSANCCASASTAAAPAGKVDSTWLSLRSTSSVQCSFEDTNCHVKCEESTCFACCILEHDYSHCHFCPKTQSGLLLRTLFPLAAWHCVQLSSCFVDAAGLWMAGTSRCARQARAPCLQRGHAAEKGRDPLSMSPKLCCSVSAHLTTGHYTQRSRCTEHVGCSHGLAVPVPARSWCWN